MKVTMLLADAAQAVGGKLYILGGGWSTTGPQPAPMAIALKVEVPWEQANHKHTWELSLLDAGGKLVTASTPQGEMPVTINGEFEIGRSAVASPELPLDISLALQFGTLPLQPGSRFNWKLSIDGQSREEWQVSFATRPATS